MLAPEPLSIGPDTSLELLGFDPVNGAVFELAGTSGPLAGAPPGSLVSLDIFWDRLETECVAACCGVHAFGWWPGDIARAVHGLNRPDVLAALRRTQEAAQNAGTDIVSYDRLNQLFARASFLQLLNHVLAALATGNE
jgi:hypothetical protein